MYALFGDGTPGSTAYTRLWDSSCIPSTVTYLPANYVGGNLNANTIYILNSWNYTLNTHITFNGGMDCSALIGRGEVNIKSNSFQIRTISNPLDYYNYLIIDNIHFSWSSLIKWLDLRTLFNSTVNNMEISNNNEGIFMKRTDNILINNVKLFNNTYGIYWRWINRLIINNALIYNNLVGIRTQFNSMNIIINNSQIYNNSFWYLNFASSSSILANNSIFYNNDIWLGNGGWGTTVHINDVSFYNNWTGLVDTISPIPYFWTLKLFWNTINTLAWLILIWSPPSLSLSAWQIDTWATTMDYDRVTNPQNASGAFLLSGINRTWLRSIQPFAANTPIRYIFGSNILKQKRPIAVMIWWIYYEYWADGADYTTTRYIAEPDSTLSPPQQTLVNQYFWSGSTFTQNWQTNGCSLSAFQVVSLSPGNFTSTYNFQDHTIYILTGGEYRSTVSTWNRFVFNGNCIALIGTKDTRFTKSGAGAINLLYANNQRNLIIDGIKVDWLYFGPGFTSSASYVGINFNGTTNNNTLNNVQIYNNTQYGIFLGLGSHHTTIINAQLFNNGIAGVYLYYASNYNVINNTQVFNNGSYGIWFANGSSRNTMNNFQAYNNQIGVFGDLTTQENIINRAAIYNNTDAGIYFKNASGNSLNDVRLYNNTVGIRTLYSSANNKFYGELRMFDNWTNFDGTTAADWMLSVGSAGLFPYAGAITTGSNLMWCTYVTNPNLSGTSVFLLSGNCNNAGYYPTFISSNNTYINYMFGLNIYKQKVPVRYDTGNILVQIPSQYDATKYIAEIFAIWDDTPENVNFIGSGAAQLNTWYTTTVYTATVLNTTVNVNLSFIPTTTSGYLIISGNNVGLTGLASNGDTIQIALLSATGYNQTVTWTITIWSVTSSLIVTTRGFNQLPNTWSFAFTNLTSIPLNTFTGSTTTVGGIETGVLASITFDPITSSGRLEIYSGTTLINSWTTWLLVYNGNLVKAIVQSSSGYTQTITWYVTIGLGTGVFTITTKWSDSTPPTTPTALYPLSGESLFFVTFEWTASTDTGSGIEWYVYELAEDNSFTNIVDTWLIQTVTGTVWSPSTTFDVTSDRYYWRIKAKDRDGNYSTRSNIWYVKVVNNSDRDSTNKENANLITYYDSNEITLDGIKAGLSVWAGVSGTGRLFKNGTNKWTGTLVQNDDVIYISLRSSNIYDNTVSSTLTIANRRLEFDVTTKLESNSECTLSNDDKDTIQTIFDSLVENYAGDQNLYDEFLLTMQSMLADEIDFTNDCNLQFLEDLISDQLIMGTWSVNTWNHIAPNCKEYPVSFDNTRIAYTSPIFKVVTYFANRDSLARYIDSKNPGDCNINTYGASSWVFTNDNPNRHIAPNGKIYTIQNYGGYTSSEFSSPKNFSTVSELRSFIDSKNPPQEIRSHQVDTSFTPQTYVAPNEKTYTIYKTNRWYMSYKLLKVRYFSTLAEIQNYININNR